MIGYCTTSTGWATVAAYMAVELRQRRIPHCLGIPVRNVLRSFSIWRVPSPPWGKFHSQLLYGRPIPQAGAGCLGPPNRPLTRCRQDPVAGGRARGYGLAFVKRDLDRPLVGNKRPFTKPAELSGKVTAFLLLHRCFPVHRTGSVYDEVESTVREIRSQQPATGFDRVACRARWNGNGLRSGPKLGFRCIRATCGTCRNRRQNENSGSVAVVEASSTGDFG